MLDNFHSRVGAESEAWPTCLGHHDIGGINENEQTSRAVLSSWTVCDQHILPVQGAPQGLMETPMFLPLASARPIHHQACGSEQCVPQLKLPQCKLQHRPLPCCQQSEVNA